MNQVDQREFANPEALYQQEDNMLSPAQARYQLFNEAPPQAISNAQEIYQNEINMVKMQIQRQLQDIYDYQAPKEHQQDEEEIQDELGGFEDPAQIYAQSPTGAQGDKSGSPPKPRTQAKRKDSNEQPRTRKPPIAQVAPNTKYLKTTIGHDMRKSFEVG